MDRRVPCLHDYAGKLKDGLGTEAYESDLGYREHTVLLEQRAEPNDD